MNIFFIQLNGLALKNLHLLHQLDQRRPVVLRPDDVGVLVLVAGLPDVQCLKELIFSTTEPGQSDLSLT